jgi:DNA-binding NtrC family response regulator
MKRILLVDDEANILASLKRELLTLDEDLGIDTHTSPAAALETAQNTKYDLVIADYKMAEMDGVAFLKAMREMQPDAVCLMLSGQVDRESLIAAINCTHIFRFIGKPWTTLELSEALSQATAYQQAVVENARLAESFRQQHGAVPTLFDPDKHYQVLVVDDEPHVLTAVSRALSYHSAFAGLYAGVRHHHAPAQKHESHDFRFIVDTCSSPLQALAQAKAVAYDLVITDFRMPDMDGICFLDEFRKIQPDAARIMLSGQADMNTLIAAINRSEIFAFIGKPWSEYDLKSVVAQAIAYRNLLAENRHLAERLAQSAPA